MFVNKLGMTVSAKQNTKIVKPGHHTLKFNAIDKKDCQRCFGFAYMIKESILEVLGSFCHLSCLILYNFVIHYGELRSPTSLLPRLNPKTSLKL